MYDFSRIAMYCLATIIYCCEQMVQDELTVTLLSNHTDWMTVVSPTGRPKLVFNRCVKESF